MPQGSLAALAWAALVQLVVVVRTGGGDASWGAGCAAALHLTRLHGAWWVWGWIRALPAAFLLLMAVVWCGWGWVVAVGSMVDDDQEVG